MRTAARVVAVIGLLIPVGSVFGQWSNDPANNLNIANRANEQVQPKVRTAPDGSVYVAWFDNAGGGYDVYLQRLSSGGVEQWAHNGVLIADRAVSSTVDYDLRVDAQGNAIVVFNDDRAEGGVQQISVAKVNPSGQLVWSTPAPTAGSVQVSSGTAFKGNPRVAVLSDGNIVVGWSETPGFMMQKVGPGGGLVGDRVTVSETGRTISLADLQPSNNASVIALWTRPFNTSFLSSKYLYTQKYDAGLTAVWTPTTGAAAVVVYGPTGAPYGTQGGSVQNGYFPTFLSDGQGGAVYGWYENAGPRRAYVQHVRSDGTFAFQAHGLPVANIPGGQIAVGAAFDYDPATGEIFAAWPQTDGTTQSQNSVYAQKIGADGSYAWNAGGVNVIATNSNQPSFIRTLAAGDGGSYVMGFDARSATTGVVFSAKVGADGNLSWPDNGISFVSTRQTGKARLDVDRLLNGQPVLAWGDGDFGMADILVQNLRSGGALGLCPADIGSTGGLPGPDNAVNNNDFVVYIDLFFASDPRADLGTTGGVPGSDGLFNNNDFVVFIDQFFAACP